jgi:hypothetical protein
MVAAMLGVSSFCLVAEGSAQSGHRVTVGLMPMSGSTTLATRSGTAGAKVWIRTASLPPRTEVQIMMGALRDGFEVIATRATDDTGRFEGLDSLQIEVPAWVKHDRPYVVIVTDAEYRPLGSADMFHPTDRNGALTRVGKVAFDGVGCPVLTGAADEMYFLTGNTSAIRSGERVRVVGRAIDQGPCGNATAIDVQQVERLPAP